MKHQFVSNKENRTVGKFRFGRGFLKKKPRLPMPSTRELQEWIERDPALGLLYRHGNNVGIYVKDIKKLYVTLPQKQAATHKYVLRYYQGQWRRQEIYPPSWFYHGMLDDNHGQGYGWRKVRMDPFGTLRSDSPPFDHQKKHNQSWSFEYYHVSPEEREREKEMIKQQEEDAIQQAELKRPIPEWDSFSVRRNLSTGEAVYQRRPGVYEDTSSLV
eukprot:CAMPEP_0167803046 /NCGR_PEP_ID=MMETSP0111_2-20121227/19533_1 /TAXON_ID=91324 /ORGANISM="Lotharella globosa, Strain CCCM811" /LENGTH=214 /DNA_ID=CAMNT_0007699301 /DNA_START=33 /DNA_END=678 /DNA_ORIENTATION=+